MIGPDVPDNADSQPHKTNIQDTTEAEAEPVLNKIKDEHNDQNQGQQIEENAISKKDWTKEIPQLRGF